MLLRGLLAAGGDSAHGGDGGAGGAGGQDLTTWPSRNRTLAVQKVWPAHKRRPARPVFRGRPADTPNSEPDEAAAPKVGFAEGGRARTRDGSCGQCYRSPALLMAVDSSRRLLHMPVNSAIPEAIVLVLKRHHRPLGKDAKAIDLGRYPDLLRRIPPRC